MEDKKKALAEQILGMLVDFINDTNTSFDHEKITAIIEKTKELAATNPSDAVEEESEFQLLLMLQNALEDIRKLPFSESVEAKKELLEWVSIKRKKAPLNNKEK